MQYKLVVNLHRELMQTRSAVSNFPPTIHDDGFNSLAPHEGKTLMANFWLNTNRSDDKIQIKMCWTRRFFETSLTQFYSFVESVVLFSNRA